MDPGEAGEEVMEDQPSIRALLPRQPSESIHYGPAFSYAGRSGPGGETTMIVTRHTRSHLLHICHIPGI